MYVLDLKELEIFNWNISRLTCFLFANNAMFSPFFSASKNAINITRPEEQSTRVYVYFGGNNDLEKMENLHNCITSNEAGDLLHNKSYNHHENEKF